MKKKLKRTEEVEAYWKACQELAEKVNEQLFEGCREIHWVGDEVGGACDYDGTDFLTPDQMVLIIQHEMTYEQYAEWRDSNNDHQGKWINLKSWIMGLRHDMIKDCGTDSQPSTAVKENGVRYEEIERQAMEDMRKTNENCHRFILGLPLIE